MVWIVLLFQLLEPTLIVNGRSLPTTRPVTRIGDEWFLPVVPIVANDSYTVIEGRTLNVPAAGVLANDVPGQGTNLTALLLTVHFPHPRQQAEVVHVDQSAGVLLAAGESRLEFARKIGRAVERIDEILVLRLIEIEGLAFDPNFVISLGRRRQAVRQLERVRQDGINERIGRGRR